MVGATAVVSTHREPLSDTGTRPARIPSTTLSRPDSNEETTYAVPRVGWPANGSSYSGVKIRTSASTPSPPGPVTNVVSERLSWRAIDCICSSLTSAASSKTASGLPENGSSPTVKTLTIR